MILPSLPSSLLLLPPSLPPAPPGQDLAVLTPEWKESLPKNATALRGRRGAMHVKQAHVEEIKGHQFVKRFFRRAIYCSLCHEFLWWVTVALSLYNLASDYVYHKMSLIQNFSMHIYMYVDSHFTEYLRYVVLSLIHTCSLDQCESIL